MQKGQTLILLLIGALILTGVASGAYYLGTKKPATLQDTVSKQNPVILPSTSPQSNNKPTPDTKPQNNETTNWKTYTSAKNKFYFNYPGDKEVLIYSDNPDGYICGSKQVKADVVIYFTSGPRSKEILQMVKDGAGTEFQGDLVLEVDVVDNPKNLWPKDWLKKECSYDKASFSEYQESEIAVSRPPAFRIDAVGIGRFADTVIAYSGKLYYIRATLINTKPENRQVFEKILNSFKFL